MKLNQKLSTSSPRSYEQVCPVARALDVVGQRWTLLIVRDLMFGPLRFSDLREGLPGLAPNLLSERMRWLVSEGLVERIGLPPPAARQVYALTARGRELGPVIHELARFGVGDWADADAFGPPRRLLRGALLALMSPSELGEPSWSAEIRLAEGTIGLEVAARPSSGGSLNRLRLSDPPPPGAEPDVTVTASMGTLVELRRGLLARSYAERRGRLAVTGSRPATVELRRLLGWT